MKLQITSSTKLTQKGLIGAVLFVVGPLAAIFFAAMFIGARPADYGSTQREIHGLLSVAGIMAFLIGYVLLSIGRETISHATSGEDVQN